ncbi:hypothetical protein PIIN_11406, partial [Serendipita indica DSM 11827]
MTEQSPESLENYTKYFRTHLKLTRIRQYGTKRSLLVSSQVAPNGFWTSEEKERFFSALSRHSKLRPDLISLDVGSNKTVADVVAYIDVLERGLRDVSRLEVDSEEEDVPVVHPAAYTVSQKWIEFEEQQA